MAGVRFPSMERGFCLLHNVEAHPGSCTVGMGEGALFPQGYSSRGLKLIIHVHLVLRSRMVELFLHSPYAFMV
jgi:hypothetical protein